ncbi:hypothetical protein QTP70_002030 [Hemibagrus guttatus]|uniref:Reverse transcriptase domain-containing protein n=1 Tax=Hemibagrus guttatus TaxID=175788 RepID=A0AAE0V148_9TELE|nr:hypothetical protein QTP70_002030 [Hemibagrus guttatus]
MDELRLQIATNNTVRDSCILLIMTWLHPYFPDSSIELAGYTARRQDRTVDSVRGITMVRSKKLSETFRKKIVDSYESGKGYNPNISKEFVISHSTVQKIIYKWRTFEKTVNMARSGHPSKFTPRADRKMLKDVSKNPKISSRDLHANLHLSRFSSTCSLLSLQITMPSANIIVQGDSCLTSSDNWSITIANRKWLSSGSSYSREELMNIRATTPVDLFPSFLASTADLLAILIKEARNKVKSRRRGKRSGVLVRLRRRGLRTPLPGIFLSNVRSLCNKMDELTLQMNKNRDFPTSCVLCFTEMWLCDAIPDSALQLGGFNLYRADRHTELSGKTKGGGICFYTNNSWCNDVKVLSQLCSPDLEAFIINCKPFYSPREFSSFILVGVYIPPQGNVREAQRALADEIQSVEQTNPDALVIVLGDFNKGNLSHELPKYKQFIKCPTREGNVLDHCYTTISGAYRAVPRAALGQSDHIMVHLIPAYRQKLKLCKPVVRTSKKWTSEAVGELQGCLDCTDWDVFRYTTNSLDEYTDTVSSYIYFCEDSIIPTCTRLSPTQLHTSATPHPPPLTPLTIKEEEVNRLFKCLNTRKATGPDSVSPSLLKHCANQLSPVFTDIFNTSLETCHVPACFKTSAIVPVPKKTKITGLNDYRPVALISVVMKSFERLVLSYLKDITDPLLDPLQFAYRANRSVDDAVNMALHFILQHLDSPGSYARILWITDFLTDRRQFVRLGTHSVKLLKFADDTTLIGLISDGNESAYRGTTITKELKWEQNISSFTKKAQQRMYFLRQLKKFLLPVKMLVNFYTAIIESVLISSITVWFAAATPRDKAKLQRVIHSAEKANSRGYKLRQGGGLLMTRELGLEGRVQPGMKDGP